MEIARRAMKWPDPEERAKRHAVGAGKWSTLGEE